MIKDYSILLVEDSPMEVMKVRRAMDTLGLTHELIVAQNGEEALEILNGLATIPNLILIDLNMPKMNGFELLSILKEIESLQNIPIVILTSSDSEQDIKNCYEKGITGFITKPTKYTDYVKKMKDLFEYCNVMEITKAS